MAAEGAVRALPSTKEWVDVMVELAQETVQLMLVEGLALSEIDAFIERQPLDDDEKAALWLWAWAEQSLAAR